ncbi:MAG: glutamate-5-semialdehyde dehydrogenase [Planctomycetota bacterium]|nr:glutamate-5-semialdehyde dehydrogenase [Planctomycetota bacterium]
MSGAANSAGGDAGVPGPILAAARAAREASYTLAFVPTDAKNAMLRDLADRLMARQTEILAANEADVAAARGAGLAAAKLQRLQMTAKSIEQMSEGVRQVAALPDPVGQVVKESTVPSGLLVRKVRVPLGVIAMIYEARPAVTIDAFALCFKAGNACLLKGGREAAGASGVLASIAHEALREHGLPSGALASISDTSRDDLRALLQLDTLIDLVIPRGGTELIRFVAQHSRIPTIQHYHGVCHMFVDDSADLERALQLVVSAKTSAPATCNALECVLVHRGIAERFVPRLAEMCAAAGVRLHADSEAFDLAVPSGRATTTSRAQAEDWGKEFLELTLACRVVSDVDEAIGHIQRYGSLHTDAIVSQTPAHQERFIRRVGSSCVLVNTSTRFNDGFQLGLGAEIGISTSKIHAFGPMGLEELTIARYEVRGDYQTR